MEIFNYAKGLTLWGWLAVLCAVAVLIAGISVVIMAGGLIAHFAAEVMYGT